MSGKAFLPVNPDEVHKKQGPLCLMFVFDPLNQGLELLAKRDLQKAESLFLKVINDPYVQSEDLDRARSYLNDIRSCQTGSKTLDFDQ